MYRGRPGQSTGVPETYACALEWRRLRLASGVSMMCWRHNLGMGRQAGVIRSRAIGTGNGSGGCAAYGSVFGPVKDKMIGRSKQRQKYYRVMTPEDTCAGQASTVIAKPLPDGAARSTFFPTAIRDRRPLACLRDAVELQNWAISSVGQSTCLTSRGSLVRARHRPPYGRPPGSCVRGAFLFVKTTLTACRSLRMDGCKGEEAHATAAVGACGGADLLSLRYSLAA